MKLIIFTLILSILNGFEKTEYENFEPRLGLLLETPFSPILEILAGKSIATSELPESLDYRKTSKCVHPIRNQGKCGSCWAHAISEVMSDRVCLDSNGKVDEVFSPQQLVDCDYLDHGCNGGNLLFPWLYYGLVGASTEKCYGPYTSGNTGSYNFCFLKKFSCKTTKIKFSTITFSRSIDAIKEEIKNHGPVVAGFQVHEDFMKYKSGIYGPKNDAGRFLGGHAIKIVGWGKEKNVGYWIIQNSWGPTWGENGFFRMEFGSYGVESMVINARPNI